MTIKLIEHIFIIIFIIMLIIQCNKSKNKINIKNKPTIPRPREAPKGQKGNITNVR